jgi:iron complex outermembrane recepter protein
VGLGGAVDVFVGTPGTQATIDTTGNVNLKPENGTSVTLGLVWAPRGSNLSGSVDFYRIDVKKAITVPDSNEFIADCYNYYGRNPTYDPNNGSCQAIGRAGDILAVLDPADPVNGYFAGTNEGRLLSSGIDVAVGWESMVGPGRLTLGLNLNYLLSAKQQTRANLPEQEFKGTIPYFGAGPGLGQAFPKIKSTFSSRYAMGAFTVDGRLRYIDKMSNRMNVIFPGESFTGTPATTYLDLGASWEFLKGMTLRVGLNNALDQEARTYAPNVQSGTDPSTYDVVGRRLFMSLQAQFK